MLFCTALLVSGCDSTPLKSGSTEPLESADDTALFSKTKAAIKARDFELARKYLFVLDSRTLEPTARTQKLLLGVELEIVSGNTLQAKRYFDLLKRNKNKLSQSQSRQHALLIARWYEAKGMFLAAARQRIFLSGDLSGETYYANHEQIWQDLMRLPFAELTYRAKEIEKTVLGRWLQLAGIAKNPTLTLDAQVKQIQFWQRRYARHPAGLKLPGGLALLKDLSKKRPVNIALWLPLTGRLERTGIAIRDGFMASFYASFKMGYAVPKVHVFDSNKITDVDEMYAQAKALGVQWVIGPVSKDKVSQLAARSDLALPTLALNYVLEENAPFVATEKQTTDKTTNNLYQFGLSAVDEAIKVAAQARLDGHKNALVLVPQGRWGERVGRAFERHWKSLGGVISGRQYYPKRKDYNPDIRHLLNVDDSKRRYTQIRRLLPGKVEFEPRARQDADWLFMVALPNQARQIKPTLAFNFSAKLPVYATSHLYAGKQSQAANNDLNGIIFCDMPWLLGANAVAQEIDLAVGEQGAYARLYALGADTYRLLPRVLMLKAIPYGQFFGYTGALNMDSTGKIHRQTECARFKRGIAEPLNVGVSL